MSEKITRAELEENEQIAIRHAEEQTLMSVHPAWYLRVSSVAKYGLEVDVKQEYLDAAYASGLRIKNARIATLEAELAQLRAEGEGMREDVENYRWLIGDLYKPGEMEARRRLLQRMDLMGRGAIASAIDAARKEADRGK